MGPRTTPGRGSSSHGRAGGYTLVAIMMFLAILTITIMAVGPAVSKIMQRENEEELIFRGKQYASAILVFQRKQGRLPLKLEELMKTRPRSIRRLFSDPICRCDDWGVIHVGDPWPRAKGGASGASGPSGAPGWTYFPGGPESPPPPGEGLPSTYTQPPGNRTQPNARVGEEAPLGSSGSAGGRSTGGPFDGDPSLPGNGEEVHNRPIIGVYSKVHKKGIRTYKGQEYYDDWGFIAGQNNDDLFPLEHIPGGRGMPGAGTKIAPPPQNPGTQTQPN